ncbi:MAG TPA: hypothetical protein PKY82_02735 [Pyrinomonadaceae bacterium]|nr:hypothetical protein [Pyrinomonadaceae bacterium]
MRIKTLSIITLIILLISSTFAQESAAIRFQKAQEAFDNSEYEKTLTLLNSIQKDYGDSPRIESLRALTLRDLNRPREAYQSLLIYFKLTAKLNLKNNAAHQALIELKDQLQQQLEKDVLDEKESLKTNRGKNTNNELKESNQTEKSTDDPLAELEMWNKVKTSTNAADYQMFIMRYPNGSFANLAKTKMTQLGDPVWNEVNKSKDAFVYRDFIKKNPNSPFVEAAKEKMKALTASMVDWEQIKDSSNPADFENYIKKYPDGTYTEDARKKVSLRYQEFIAKGKASVNAKNYEAAVRLFNEAANLDKNNPEPYELIGDIYWKKIFNEDGSAIDKAEQSYIESLKRGGKVIFITTIATGWSPGVWVTVTPLKCVIAADKYTYETDYDGLIIEKHEKVSVIMLNYPKALGKYFGVTGKGNQKQRELALYGYYDDNSVEIYRKLYKFDNWKDDFRKRTYAFLNILKTAQELSKAK